MPAPTKVYAVPVSVVIPEPNAVAETIVVYVTVQWIGKKTYSLSAKPVDPHHWVRDGAVGHRCDRQGCGMQRRKFVNGMGYRTEKEIEWTKRKVIPKCKGV